MKVFARLGLAVSCVAVSVPLQAAQPAQAWSGKWQLNVRESRFSGPAPRWEIRTIGISHNRMPIRSRGATAGGKSIHFNYSVALDGRLYPLVGNPDGDSIRMKLVRPEQVVIDVQRHRRPAASAVTTVNANRLVMERHRLALSGSPSDDRLVYDRVR